MSNGEKKGPMVSVGFDNYVFIHAIVAILAAESAPAKRLMHQARQKDVLLDATSGRKTRSVIVTSGPHIITSAISPETIAERAAWHNA